MKDESIYFIEMQKKVGKLDDVADYHALINHSAACRDLFDREKAYTVLSSQYQLRLDTSSKQYTKEGVEIKKSAATDFSITASTMSSYGVKINNTELAGLKERFTFTNLYKKTEVALLADCNLILNLIDQNTAGLEDYNIDASYTTALRNTATNLETVTQLPQDVIKQHAEDNKMYEDHEKEVKKFFKKEMDPFMKIYMKINMPFYLAYLGARHVRHHHLKRKPKIVDTETTTGILDMLVLEKDTLHPLADVGFVIPSLNISESSDEDGDIYIDEIVPGGYKGKLHAEGYKDVDVDLVVKVGETTGLQFLMEKVGE